ncbi:heme NO-binding domain-containing protein [Roseovarius sp. SK2]|uniref:heme NO-binding domain-containing protein n=1 Tax=Roseovarius TaxID=74030 RepID=UPI00237C3EB7|nr:MULTISPECIES: heme NO-binding domain-containing protein [unclassified Roseovarius]MDD9724788.1 heme NO-binding domain-containing protein [Roseovarius sp. SK2]
MHGLINRAIELFLRDTYGHEAWEEIARRADLAPPEFEAMLDYPDALTGDVLVQAAQLLDKAEAEILEDIGTYLVSHPTAAALRRLLRFSGADFTDFLHSLDDLPARARLAAPQLDLPPVALVDRGQQVFSVTVGKRGTAGFAFGHVLLGLLRAMADDYGALVLLEHKGCRDGVETIDVQLLEAAFATGRSFVLGDAG